MTGGILSAEIQARLQTAFPSVFVGMPQDNAMVTLPAIRMQLQSDVVVGSPLEVGRLTLLVESQADDTTPADHAAFASAVDAAMRAMEIETSEVTLAGVVAKQNAENHQERHWQTVLEYTIGFSPTV